MRALVLFLRLFGKLLVSFMQTIAALNASPHHVKRYLNTHMSHMGVLFSTT